MGYLTPLMIGFACGAGSWGLGALLSGRFEPFDSAAGFWCTQIVLGGGALLIGCRYGFWRAMAVVFGGYLGFNLYGYVLGGAEARGWFLLGLITTLSLTLMPFVAGLTGALIHRRRYGVRALATSGD